MGLTQVAIGVCNDGNVSQLDVADEPSGEIYYRIEVYRCSHPAGGYGVTLSGSRAEHICGADHLGPASSRTFRYLFSIGDADTYKSALPVVLEGREIFNPEGQKDGSWDVRLRDLDPESGTYGAVACASVSPLGEAMTYQLDYEIMVPVRPIERVPILSPIGQSLATLNPALPDIGAPLEAFGRPAGRGRSRRGRLSVALSGSMGTGDVSAAVDEMLAVISAKEFVQFRRNLDLYEAFGDFGSKAVHPGTNLVGPNQRLAAESIFVRQYRAALVLMGRISSPDMARGAARPVSLAEVPTNTRPGVYANFVGAAINNIGIYKLGLDKVHSDYGGVPMALAPGSRLETGVEPLQDAWRCNQTLGEMAKILYLADA